MDTLIATVGELRGDMRALNARMGQIETTVERLVQARTAAPLPAHYWTIIFSFIIAALLAALLVLYMGTPR